MRIETMALNAWFRALYTGPFSGTEVFAVARVVDYGHTTHVVDPVCEHTAPPTTVST